MQKTLIFNRDLKEINKIELLDDHGPDMKKRVLGPLIPLFLVKVSKSYYQKVGQYSQTILEKVNNGNLPALKEVPANIK